MTRLLRICMAAMWLSLVATLLTDGSVALAQTHYVMIETNMGNMKVMLYDDTPKTTANFLKKVREGYYNETLFGRVIQSFMIQGGAPDSRNAGPGWSLGYGDIDEEIDGEIRANHIPKKGALAAPHREKMKNSDMSMFFIVQGYVQSREYWEGWEKVNNAEARKAAKRKVMTKAVKDTLIALKPDEFAKNEVRARYNEFVRQLNHQIDSVARATPGTRFFTEDELEAYSTIGGAYHLYKEYTIYGEVVEGLDVIDKIAELETNSADRPRQDVRMNIRVIK
ncbi:MAG: peptidylprolyl isomerase [Bacteroidales bacterium]|nr:peptidylprolyl isomerase [Bacteroidales bacterium]